MRVRRCTACLGHRIGFRHCRKHIMTKTTLRIVTLKTVANYRRVAEHAVGAYRASGHRLLAMVRRNLDPVSYTHLDVYKRQSQTCTSPNSTRCMPRP